ncbi:NAD(P)-binding protein [Mycena alexandri]|uniref:NAD(P)-binding protein n=1 Tax=Mycena alexandri TaxID=1745969 RepID=A0AAD6XCS8_9AGAR|nr:NAD(P)-binding protein [Mycena alexandri]
MTITQAVSAPLIAVVGATGQQGGSVIKALAESNKQYRIRAFTRDVTKAAAEALKAQGVDVVAVNLVVENKDAVYRAFSGADFAFLVTNFWEFMDKEKEAAQGKLLIDAANAASVKGIIWSGLVSCETISRGKYAQVFHFDGKAIVAEYGRQSGAPFVDVQAGFYANNLLGNPALLAKQSDGTYLMPWAMRPEVVLPIIDTASDYGLFVRQVLEAPVFPDGSEVFTSSEELTAADLARQLSEITGKKIVFKQITVEEATKNLAATGLPPAIVAEMIEMIRFIDEFGYYGGKATTSHVGLGRQTRTWAEFVKGADWSKALG